jgi:site-specific DNA recombinase
MSPQLWAMPSIPASWPPTPKAEKGTDMLKAIGYCRISISTEKQQDDVSLENQQDRIAAYCAYKGFDLIRIITTDEAIAEANSPDKTELSELLDVIESREIQAVVLYSLERLSRDMLTLLAVERLLNEYEVSLHTIKGEINTASPEGFMSFAMKAFSGEVERRQLKYRTKKAMEYKKVQGVVVGAIPYGYQRGVNSGDFLVEVPAEQRVIQLANTLYEQGQRVQHITDVLNESGYQTRNGKPFDRTQVARLIKGYAGKKRQASPMGEKIRAIIVAIRAAKQTKGSIVR